MNQSFLLIVRTAWIITAISSGEYQRIHGVSSIQPNFTKAAFPTLGPFMMLTMLELDQDCGPLKGPCISPCRSDYIFSNMCCLAYSL